MTITSPAGPDLVSRVARFRRMHDGPRTPLVMPNAWDAASAKLLAARPTVAAIGTSSAAVAAAAGTPDGEQIGLAQALRAAEEIVEAVDLPVNVDLEAGFGATPDAVARSARGAVDVGAAGVNIEDTDPRTGELRDPRLQEEILLAACEAAGGGDEPMMINARTDVFWNKIAAPQERRDAALVRLRLYRDTGAGCVFFPGVEGTAADLGPVGPYLEDLVRALAPTPVNLLASSRLDLSLTMLGAIGVRRISFGSSLYRAALAQVVSTLDDVDDSGCFDAMADADRLPYGRLAGLLG